MANIKWTPLEKQYIRQLSQIEGRTDKDIALILTQKLGRKISSKTVEKQRRYMGLKGKRGRPPKTIDQKVEELKQLKKQRENANQGSPNVYINNAEKEKIKNRIVALESAKTIYEKQKENYGRQQKREQTLQNIQM